MPVRIGTSGWHYQHWRGLFYPASLPSGKWLEFYAQRFATVEINNAFYRLPDTAALNAWAAAVPDDFVMAVKASRYLTHIRRLRDPQEPASRMVQRLASLGSRFGPVLVQLPPNLTIDTAALCSTLAALSAQSVAVEFRHPSWYTGETRRLLEKFGATLCLTDSKGPQTPWWRTASWGYVRFHQGRGQPSSGYGRQALQHWAERLADLWPDPAELFVYFNNDVHGCAPRDARRFATAVKRVGLVATRVPAPRETPTWHDRP
jgi:uncharacterized protein YecE (DUF72 family)